MILKPKQKPKFKTLNDVARYFAKNFPDAADFPRPAAAAQAPRTADPGMVSAAPRPLTSVCVMILRGRTAVAELPAPPEAAISAIVAAELWAGAVKAKRASEAAALEQLLDFFPVLDFTQSVTRIYGELRADLERRGQPLGPFDLLIAAHARSLGARRDSKRAGIQTRQRPQSPGVEIRAEEENAASRHYFGVTAKALTREQSAMLAAVLPNPRGWDPTKPGRTLRRRQRRILQREQNAHFPDQLLR